MNINLVKNYLESADDSTVLVTITEDSPDISDIALSKFMDWTVANDMH